MSPRIYFKHFLSDSPELKAFHEALGRNVVLWGRFEATMDHTMLDIMYHPHAAVQPAVIPTSFKKKADFWKALFKKEPSMAAVAERAAKLASDAKVLFGKRNDILHASIGRLEDDESAVSVGYRHAQDGRIAMPTNKVSTRLLQDLERETTALYGRLSIIASHAMFHALDQGQGPQSQPPEAAETKESPGQPVPNE